MTTAIALSGGADSLFSLALLREQESKLIGIHAFFLPPTDKDREKARTLKEQCRLLDVQLYTVDVSRPFEEKVIRPFVSSYLNGKTPNPCAWCNRKIKFDLLLDAAADQGAGTLATGHYARIMASPGGPALFRGEDPLKDQSYFLALVPPAVWPRVVFPLGTWRKKDVLPELPKRHLTPVDSEESQEICFIPDDYRTFLQQRGVSLPGPGPVATREGKILGTHKGLWRYTQGQRRGLAIAYEYPLYVLGKNRKNNTLIVGSQEELWAEGCEATHINIMLPLEQWPDTLLVQTRYRQKAGEARVRISGETLHVTFIDRQEAPTPGQILAVYAPSGQLLAGGVITRGIWAT